MGVLLVAGSSGAATLVSASYAIPNDVLSSGGADMATADYGVSSTLGQPSAIGISSSGSYKNSAGFWPPVFSAAGGQAVLFSLSIDVSPGEAGTVQAPGITCPVDCSGGYNEGTQIDLAALPLPGYEFDHWEGGVVGSDNPLQIVMDRDMTITAVFTVSAGDKPLAGTDDASLVTDTSATIQGSINPNGFDTSYYFEYSTALYGVEGCFENSTAPELLLAGFQNSTVSYDLSDLQSNTTYYFRLVAVNSEGSTYGDILTFTTQFTGVGSPPDKPALTLPLDGDEDVSVLSVFYASLFSDPDAGDRHKQTKWQISETCDFHSVVFERISSTSLTSLKAPHLDLSPDTTYYWRVRYYDNHLNPSDWSDISAFKTIVDANDSNLNGIPDTLENDTVDLDNNSVPDIQQDDIKSLNTLIGDCQVGVSIANEPKALRIEAIDAIDHENISDVVRPSQMPLGLIAFRLLVASPGDTVNVDLYFCRPLSEGMNWYNYNSVDGWVDYSEYAQYSPDRKSLTLELQDGGHGDADGVANGIIVDPCGSGIASFVQGLVYDAETSEGIAQAAVILGVETVTTFDDGHYLSMLLPGQYAISVLAQGYDPLYDTMNIPEGFTVTIDLGLNPLTQNTGPIATITSPGTDTTINTGDTVIFRCSVVNGNPPLTYAWNFAGVAADSSQQNPGSVTFDSAGTYVITLTVTDDDGDTSSDSVTIIVNDPSDDGDGGGGGGGGGCYLETMLGKF